MLTPKTRFTLISCATFGAAGNSLSLQRLSIKEYDSRADRRRSQTGLNMTPRTLGTANCDRARLNAQTFTVISQ